MKKELSKHKINEMAQKGITDVEIARKLSLSHYGVQKYTTAYWLSKMNENKESL